MTDESSVPSFRNQAESELSRAVDKAYRVIRMRIVTGVLAGGAQLAEEELALSIGVSRTPVREALKRLHGEGLVVLERYRQGRVAQISEDDIQEIFEIRRDLESMAARRAARRITPEMIDKMEAVNNRLEALVHKWQPDMVPQFIDLNIEFHLIVLEASGSRRLKSILTPMIDMPLTSFARRTPHRASVALYEQAVRHHRELIDALRSHDEDWASTQMRAHLSSSHAAGAMDF